MKVPYKWLGEYVDLENLTAQDVAKGLTEKGLETVLYSPKSLEGVVVGRISQLMAHPQADKLTICFVDIGEEQELQIVCGAKNIAREMYVPVAKVGSKLPNGIVIKKAKLRGVDSFGMMCSSQELGLDEDNSEGIMVLEHSQVGSPMAQHLGLDQVLDIELTANRGDCLAIIGVAYEVAALFNRKLRLPQPKPLTFIEEKQNLPKGCTQLVTMELKHVKVGPSMPWVANRLRAAGIRPINNIVDLTNYVMLEMGQPLHAYDKAKINKLQVRPALEGEQIELLNKDVVNLSQDMLVVADNERPHALVGIIGGAQSKVTSKTSSVIFEAARLNSRIVRRAARSLGLRSEASQRFERAVKMFQLTEVLARVAELSQCIFKEAMVQAIHLQGVQEETEQKVNFTSEQLTSLAGKIIPTSSVQAILKKLQFNFTMEQNNFVVLVPRRRVDLWGTSELVAEIIRLYGYDKLASIPLAVDHRISGISKREKAIRNLCNLLSNLGFKEVKNYSLRPLEEPIIDSDKTQAERISVKEPMSRELAILRNSLWPGLLETAKYNWQHSNKNIMLYELGRIYTAREDQQKLLAHEHLQLAGLFIPKSFEVGLWTTCKTDEEAFFKLKGYLELILQRLGVQEINFQKKRSSIFHPALGADILVAGEIVGDFGLVHPVLLNKQDLPGTCLFKLSEAIFHVRDLKHKPLSKQPALIRDLALVVPKEVEAVRISKLMKEIGGELLEQLTLFDLYEGEQVPDECKSLAYRLVYRSLTRTLADEEIDTLQNKILLQLQKTVGAVLRD
ncbi:MAG: hypothetical protein RLZ12_738 [Bacillota bacterium]|jgi:phenylalanyl-tRNA synthetase beta chain